MPQNLIEELEPRLVLSALTFGPLPDTPVISLHNGTLTIRGTNGPDRISMSVRFPSIFPPPPGSKFSLALQVNVNGQFKIFNLNDVQHVDIDGGPGNDLIKLQPKPHNCGPSICPSLLGTP